MEQNLEECLQNYIRSIRQLTLFYSCAADRSGTVDMETWKGHTAIQAKRMMKAAKDLKRALLQMKLKTISQSPEIALREEIQILKERVSKQDVLLSTVKSKIDTWRSSSLLRQL